MWFAENGLAMSRKKSTYRVISDSCTTKRGIEEVAVFPRPLSQDTHKSEGAEYGMNVKIAGT